MLIPINKKNLALKKARKLQNNQKIIKFPEKQIDYMFINGMKLTGTIKQIKKIASTLGLKINYNSIKHHVIKFYPSVLKKTLKNHK